MRCSVRPGHGHRAGHGAVSGSPSGGSWEQPPVSVTSGRRSAGPAWGSRTLPARRHRLEEGQATSWSRRLKVFLCCTRTKDSQSVSTGPRRGPAAAGSAGAGLAEELGFEPGSRVPPAPGSPLPLECEGPCGSRDRRAGVEMQRPSLRGSHQGSQGSGAGPSRRLAVRGEWRRPAPQTPGARRGDSLRPPSSLLLPRPRPPPRTA